MESSNKNSTARLMEMSRFEITLRADRNMNRPEEVQITLDWVQEAPFRVQLQRTIPRARRLPESFVEPFYMAEEEAWRSTAAFFM